MFKKGYILSILLLCAVTTGAWAQRVDQKVDSVQLSYYRWVNQHKMDPAALAKADTLFMLAGKDHNRRMQAVALCLKIDHYYAISNLDSMKIAVDNARRFTEEYEQPFHYYVAWARLILYYIKHNQYVLAQYEIQQLLEKAKLDNYKPGIAVAYKHLAQIYHARGKTNEAISAYTKAINFIEENKIDEPMLSYLYLQLARLEISTNGDNNKITRLLQKAEKNIQLPEEIWNVNIERVSLYINENKLDKAWELLNQVKSHQQEAGLDNEILVSTELKIFEHERQYNKALDCVNKLIALYEQKAETERKETGKDNGFFFLPSVYDSRADLYAAMGRYKEAYTDKKHAYKLSKQYDITINESSLNEFATLLDVKRLEHEKVMAQQSTQVERLHRIRSLAFAMGCSLLLFAALIVVLIMLYRRSAHARKVAEEANKMKTSFIRNVTHEINTPLNAVVGFTELATSASADDPERDSYLKMVQDNTFILQKIVDDMLYIADLEAKNERPEIAPFDLNECCRECISALESSHLQASGIAFVPTMEKIKIISSRLLLHKVINELLGNAVNFSGSGNGVKLTYVVDQEKKRLFIEVADHGPGIPPGEEEHVFERFAKVDSFSQGMGLGLAVCRQIAVALNGSIHVDTTYQEGTRIILEIPISIG